MSSGRAHKRAAKRKIRNKRTILITVVLLVVLLTAGCESLDAAASDGDVIAGLLNSRSESINVLLLLTVLTLLPSILIMLTGFTRIIIVLSLVRNGMGVQQMPPNQVLIGLALFLTFFIMSPIVEEIRVTAYEPYVAEEIDGEEAVDLAMRPIREFMFKNTNNADMVYFLNVSSASSDEELTLATYDDIPTSALIPAFITSEIKEGFRIGFYIYIPFIVVDMIVASTLMAMGMMMLPPVVISLPFKILLFVLVDGWTLTMQTLVSSFKL
jgi:flagellar biosynthetic protein FliP